MYCNGSSSFKQSIMLVWIYDIMAIPPPIDLDPRATFQRTALALKTGGAEVSGTITL